MPGIVFGHVKCQAGALIPALFLQLILALRALLDRKYGESSFDIHCESLNRGEKGGVWRSELIS